MKSKFKNINEQMDRMKSLFGESRLYGNLVEDKKIVIKEQARFFRKASDLFSVAFKSFDDLATWNKFINVEIRNIDDIIKHVDDFTDMWGIVIPNMNIPLLKDNLKAFKTVKNQGNLKNIPEDLFYDKILESFPSKGGMRDMIYDMWLEANGMSRNLPATTGEKRIVKQNPTTGEMMVGTKNNQGIVVYKDKDGDIVFTEKIDGNDDIRNVEIEDVDFEEIPANSTIKDLDGKRVPFTKQNMEEFLKSLKELSEKADEAGGGVVVTIKGENADEVNKVLAGFGSSKTGDDVVDEIVDKVDPTTTPKQKETFRKKLTKKLKQFALWTSPLWDHTTLFSSMMGKKFGGKSARWFTTQPGQIVFRTLVILPLEAEAIAIATSDKRSFVGSWEDNYVRWFLSDASMIYKKLKDKFGAGVVKLGEKIIEDTISNLSGGKIILSSVVIKIKNKALDEIMYAGTDAKDENGVFKSTLTCKDITGKNNSDIIKQVVRKHADTEKVKILDEVRLGTIDGKSPDGQQMMEYEKQLTDYFLVVINNSVEDTDWNASIDIARKNCIEKSKSEKQEEEDVESWKVKEYETTFEGGGGSGYY
jgi:hypothetical protein